MRLPPLLPWVGFDLCLPTSYDYGFKPFMPSTNISVFKNKLNYFSSNIKFKTKILCFGMGGVQSFQNMITFSSPS
jgi:hypothetical protein